MLAFFDVVSWGYGAYVTLEVTSPSGKQLQSFVSESEGRVDFAAEEDGEYNFCFKNAYSETELSFWINTETDIGLADVAKEGMLGGALLGWGGEVAGGRGEGAGRVSGARREGGVGGWDCRREARQGSGECGAEGIHLCTEPRVCGSRGCALGGCGGLLGGGGGGPGRAAWTGGHL